VGTIADIPVMVDFGSARVRTMAELFTRIFRPGDIWTHVSGGNRGEQDSKTLGPSQALIDGRKKGILRQLTLLVGSSSGMCHPRSNPVMTNPGDWRSNCSIATSTNRPAPVTSLAPIFNSA
jgi:hypothetical protein